MCRGQCQLDLSLRRTYLRLVRQEHWPEQIRTKRGPWCEECRQDLQLLQEVWIQDHCDGSLFPQR